MCSFSYYAGQDHGPGAVHDPGAGQDLVHVTHDQDLIVDRILVRGLVQGLDLTARAHGENLVPVASLCVIARVNHAPNQSE